MKYLLMICLLLSVANSAADEMDDLKQQQQHLQQLLDDVKKSEQQRDQQKAILERLEKQMECNWTLIQSYETCEQLYPRASQELLDCTAKAKANAAKCLAPAQP
jgi:cell division septum initiation protein DivIVA